MPQKFVKLINIGELASDDMMCITIGDKGILLVNSNGQYYATDEMCTHEDARLCTGSLKDGFVKCPLHGSRFELKTGKVMDDPAEDDLQTYPLKIDDNTIFICLD